MSFWTKTAPFREICAKNGQGITSKAKEASLRSRSTEMATTSPLPGALHLLQGLVFQGYRARVSALGSRDQGFRFWVPTTTPLPGGLH